MKGNVRAMKQIATFLTAGLASLGLILSSGASAASPPPQPTVNTGGITSLTPTSVILLGALNAKAEPANYRFQYGTTKAYGTQTPLQPGGRSSATIHVNQPVGGLTPNTLYHYRIVAYGARGAVIGGDRAFKTPKVPLALSISTSPSPVPFGDTFVLGGTLFGTGHSGRAVVLQSEPVPLRSRLQDAGQPRAHERPRWFLLPDRGNVCEHSVPGDHDRRTLHLKPCVPTECGCQSRLSCAACAPQPVRTLLPDVWTVAPAEVGAQVGFQLLRSGRSSLNVGGTFVHGGSPTVSTFSTIVRVRRPGVYQALVKVSDGAHVSAYSEPIRLG